MADLRDLYQQAVLDHYKKPRNARRLEDANRRAEGHNPLCGDKLSVFVHIENSVLQDVGFVGAGCAIFTASASMMTEAVKGVTELQAITLIGLFQKLITGGLEPHETLESLGDAAVFSGVRGYPVRVKCAALAWQTLRAALEGSKETAVTE